MLLRILVLAMAAAYVVYRAYLAVQLVRARRAGDTARVQALEARAFAMIAWAIGIVALGGLFLVVLVVLNARD